MMAVKRRKALRCRFDLSLPLLTEVLLGDGCRDRRAKGQRVTEAIGRAIAANALQRRQD